MTSGVGRREAAAVALWRRLPRNLAASILLILAFIAFIGMAISMRHVGTTIPVIEIVLLRQVIFFGIMSPTFLRHWSKIRRPTGFRLHLLRGATAVVSMCCGLYSVVVLPLADVTAIQTAEVLFITALAAMLLKEQVGWRRWTAAAIGFVGVGIMLRPFGQGFDPNGLFALCGALFGAVSIIALRLGTAHDRIETVLFWQGVVVLAVVAPISWFFWVRLSLEQTAIIVGMGLLFTLGQLLFTSAMRMGDASALAPLQYLRLLLMMGLGWLVYSEVPSATTALGAALILGSATYTLVRNGRRGSAIKAPEAAL